MITFPRVQVCWKDHFHASPGVWINLSDVEDLKPCDVVSVGFLIYKTREIIVIAQSISESGDATGVFVILRSCVTKMNRLRG